MLSCHPPVLAASQLVHASTRPAAMRRWQPWLQGSRCATLLLQLAWWHCPCIPPVANPFQGPGGGMMDKQAEGPRPKRAARGAKANPRRSKSICTWCEGTPATAPGRCLHRYESSLGTAGTAQPAPQPCSQKRLRDDPRCSQNRSTVLEPGSRGDRDRHPSFIMAAGLSATRPFKCRPH